jgi:hypothetical protein
MDMEVSRLNDMRALGYDKMINRKDEDCCNKSNRLWVAEGWMW